MINPLACPILISTGWRGANRPGTIHQFTEGVIHQTANPGRGADALMHARFVRQGGGESTVSFSDSVDDKRIVQIVTHDETTWQASDGFNGVGNNRGVSVETCENVDGDFSKTLRHLTYFIGLVRYAPDFFDRHVRRAIHETIQETHINPHRFYAPDKKWCPHTILDQMLLDDIVEGSRQLQPFIVHLDGQTRKLRLPANGIPIYRIGGADVLKNSLDENGDQKPDYVEIVPKYLINYAGAPALMTMYGTIIPIAPLRTMHIRTAPSNLVQGTILISKGRAVMTADNGTVSVFEVPEHLQIKPRSYGFQ